ncbi:MAG TPA: M23 family metallopeptidase [Myxococcales bacterium]|nr:M23 family metallopeptidase [Myxococcales bacterium]
MRRALALLALAGCAGAPAPAPSGYVPELDPHHQEPDLISVVHVVTPGQTLYRIARAYGVAVEELMALNGIDDPRSVAIGQKLLVPGATEVKEVPNLVAAADGGTPEVVAEADPEPPPASRPLPPSARRPPPLTTRPGQGKGDLQWPVRGVLYARFGRKGAEPHDGIDLAAPAGTPVKTAGEGTVLYAGEQQGYGKIVIVEHPGGLVTLYAHNRDLRVKAGQRVRPEQVIATVGESGRTSGPHLHFEVRRGGAPVDPLEHLGAIPPR